MSKFNNNLRFTYWVVTSSGRHSIRTSVLWTQFAAWWRCPSFTFKTCLRWDTPGLYRYPGLSLRNFRSIYKLCSQFIVTGGEMKDEEQWQQQRQGEYRWNSDEEFWRNNIRNMQRKRMSLCRKSPPLSPLNPCDWKSHPLPLTLQAWGVSFQAWEPELGTRLRHGRNRITYFQM